IGSRPSAAILKTGNAYASGPRSLAPPGQPRAVAPTSSLSRHTVGALRIPCAVLDPNWCAHESEGVADLIFQESLIGEGQLHAAIGEEHKRGWRDRRLCHVQNLHALAHRNRGTLKIDLFEKAVHLGRRDPLTAFGGDFLEKREDLLGAVSGLRRQKDRRRV